MTFGDASSKRFTKKDNDNRFYLRYKNRL